MKKTALFFRNKGFTLIEPLLVLAVIAILIGISTPYLLGSQEKALLETERDKITNSLKMSQQKAIAAYKGYDYKVLFALPRSYTLQSGTESETFSLHSKIEISSVSPVEVTFVRLSGKPNSALSLTLSSNRFEVGIEISPEGLITTTKPERK